MLVLERVCDVYFKYLFVCCYVGFLCIGISGKFIGGLKRKFVINVNGFCYGLDWMKNLVEVVLSASNFVLALEVLPFSYLLNSSLHLDWKWQEEKGREGGWWRRKKRNWSLYETLSGSILGKKKSKYCYLCIFVEIWLLIPTQIFPLLNFFFFFFFAVISCSYISLLYQKWDLIQNSFDFRVLSLENS